MLPDIFTTENVDLKKLLNAEDTELITRMKSILGPFILRRLKSDVMQQLVPKIQRVWMYLCMFSYMTFNLQAAISSDSHQSNAG